MVEQAAVNRLVAGSSPARAVLKKPTVLIEKIPEQSQGSFLLSILAVFKDNDIGYNRVLAI